MAGSPEHMLQAQSFSSPDGAAGLSRRRLMAAAIACAGLGGAAGPAGTDPGLRLHQLIAASVKADQALDPLRADQGVDGGRVFVDPLSDAYRARLLEARTAELAGLGAIDRASLGDIDRLAHDVFRYRTEATLATLSSGLFDVARMTPLDPSGGLHITFADAASGAGGGFRTVRDYETGLRRLTGFSGYLANAVARLGQGLARGYVQPRVIVVNVLAQVDEMLALSVEETPFYAPVKSFPAEVSAADQERLKAAYHAVIAEAVLPGYRLWKTWLTETYLPRAREAPGLWAMKDGERLYARALRDHTTTDLTAAAIHDIGLGEVARIRGEMETVRRQVAFDGDLHALFDDVRTDPRFYFTRSEDLLDRFRTIVARIWLGMPRLFNRKPIAPLEVRPLPAIGAARGTGYFSLGAPDGSTPGVLYFNMSMLDTRPIPTLETLTLHEGVPGHHFQGSLAQENTALPDILRFGGGFTAYVEGWGLYAESLGRELGLFTDPWQWFGHLDFEMLRAVRLVVDTGLHARRWSRDQAVAFMTDNTSMAARDIGVEIDRYIAMPGQATAYKIGELRLKALRERARVALGPRFDIRAFHDQVLMTGALPLAILETRIDGWIAAGGPPLAV